MHFVFKYWLMLRYESFLACLVVAKQLLVLQTMKQRLIYYVNVKELLIYKKCQVTNNGCCFIVKENDDDVTH